VAYSDSEGIFSFPITDPNKELHLRIEAEDYEKFDLRVVPTKSLGVQDLRLTSKARKTDSPEKVVMKPEAHPAPPPRDTASIISGRVEDEMGTVISGARVNVSGAESFVATNKAGSFRIQTDIKEGQPIKLHIEKNGYQSKDQGHIVSKQPVTVILKRQE
jgi:hypothetical protein